MKSRGSKFSGYIVPVSDLEQFKELLSNYRHLNPDACHVCSAYRINVGGRIDEHSSDDGEPRGSAGRPILNELNKSNALNSFSLNAYRDKSISSVLGVKYKPSGKNCL